MRQQHHRAVGRDRQLAHAGRRTGAPATRSISLPAKVSAVASMPMCFGLMSPAASSSRSNSGVGDDLALPVGYGQHRVGAGEATAGASPPAIRSENLTP